MDLVGFFYGFGAVQGLVLAAILLMIRSGHRLANGVMAVLVVVIALRVLQKLLVRIHFWEDAPTLALTLYPSIYAWGPLLYLYALTLVGGRLRTIHLWHFLPVVVGFLLLNVSYWQLSRDQQIDLVGYIWSTRTDTVVAGKLRAFLPAWTPLMEFYLHSLFFSVQLAVYCVLVIRLIYRHNLRLQRHFSSIDHMNLRWLRTLVYAVLLFLGLFLVFYMIPAIVYDKVDLSSVQANVQNLFLVIVIYGIGIAALFQPSILSGTRLSEDNGAGTADPRRPESSSATDVPAEAEAVAQTEKYSRSGMSMEDAQSFQMALMDIMQREKLYLNNDLTLTDLAEAAGLSSHQVSQVINSQMNQNFFSFVNNYRIQHAKRMLLDPETNRMPIVELAFEVGFQSKSAFYEAFKRVTEMTPTQFKKSISQSVLDPDPEKFRKNP